MFLKSSDTLVLYAMQLNVNKNYFGLEYSDSLVDELASGFPN